MAKLYIYGDSFSDYYMPELVTKFWFEYVANHFNLELVHRAVSGNGWNRIKNKMFLDSCRWEKEDVIITCPSYFSRVDIIDFYVEETLNIGLCSWISNLDETPKREKFYKEEWYSISKFIKKQGYVYYTWSLDELEPKYVDITIPHPDKTKSWFDWILSDSKFWVIPYPHFKETAGTLIEKDSHLSSIASLKLSEYFIQFIENEKTQSSNMFSRSN